MAVKTKEELAKRAAWSRAYYARNREARLAYNRSYFARRRKEISAYERLRRYGLTQESYDSMLDAQGGVCASCQQKADVFHVDHDHDCCPRKNFSCGNCVRGLLCGRCNLGLGNFGDSRDLLLKAAEYIRNWKIKTSGEWQ